jgi:hypothetical protein
MKSVYSALTVLACAVVLAACGSSSGTPPGITSGGNASQGIKFADCMRSHGLSNFPDPGSGGGIQIPVGSGLKPFSPAFKAAQRACASLLPGGGPGRGKPSEDRKLQLVRLAECMRAHGISDFPDPTSSPPSAPPSGGGIAFGAPGAFISVPQTMMQSPEFKTAASQCSFPGAGAKGKAAAVP